MCDVAQHFIRIETDAFLEDREDDPQQLTRDHGNRLHLLQRVLRPGCIIRMNLPKCLVMRHHRQRPLEQPIPQPLASSVTDFGLPLVLAGAACHEPQPAELLDLLGRVETIDTFLSCQAPNS